MSSFADSSPVPETSERVEKSLSVEEAKLQLVNDITPSPIHMYRVKFVVNGCWENRSRCCFISAETLADLATRIFALLDQLQDQAVLVAETVDPESFDHITDEFFALMLTSDCNDDIDYGYGGRPSFSHLAISERKTFKRLPLNEQFSMQYLRFKWKFDNILIESVVEDAPVFSYRTFSYSRSVCKSFVY